MRITVDLDEDILKAARSLARSGSISLGEAISQLARLGLTRENGPIDEETIPVFRVSPHAPPLTLEKVKNLEDECVF